MKKAKKQEKIIVMLSRKITVEEKEKLIADFGKHEAIFDENTRSILTTAPRDFVKKLAKAHRCIQSY